MVYYNTFAHTPRSRLLRLAESRLLWRGKEIKVHNGDTVADSFTGRLAGLSEQGGLVLLMPDNFGLLREHEVLSGSISV